MRVYNINNTSFGSKKFRLPVKFVKKSESINMIKSSGYKDEYISGNFVREYKNPKAEEFFNKAINAADIDEKLRYLDLMGESKIIDISLEQQLDRFIKSADEMP